MALLNFFVIFSIREINLSQEKKLDDEAKKDAKRQFLRRIFLFKKQGAKIQR